MWNPKYSPMWTGEENFITLKQYKCRRRLNKIAERRRVRILCVPGHRIMPGNCRADEPARVGTTIELSNEFGLASIPFETCGHLIGSDVLNFVNARWAASLKGKT